MVATIIEIILGIVAIAFAMFHALDLKSIVKTISTRYLDKFPAYLSDLASLLGRANHRIDIFCDFPAYGQFSNTSAFTDYKIILERKKRDGVNISLTCLSSAQRELAVKKQFTRDFAERPKAFIEKLASFLRDYGDKPADAETLTLDKFLELAEYANYNMLRDVFHHHDCCEVGQPMHIFFWLVDGREAIFCIASHSEKALEYGFFTRDGRLIDAFEAMRRRYREEYKI